MDETFPNVAPETRLKNSSFSDNKFRKTEMIANNFRFVSENIEFVSRTNIYNLE
jgi:hypothetical protein